MNKTMQAVNFQGAGGTEVIQVSELPIPEVRKGEVLIRVVAAGINRADVQQRRGLYLPPPGATDIPGLEVSGIVVEISNDHGGSFEIGDEVCALLTGGGYAEYVAVPATQVFPCPQGVSLVEAATLPEAVSTVWSNLFLEAGTKPDDWVLVHGGAGGIGTMATQILSEFGAHTIVTASSDDKLAYCKSFGAEVGINYLKEDFHQKVMEITDGHGVDVILDVIGGDYLSRNLKSLAVGGRLVTIGLQGGAEGTLDLRMMMSKRAKLIGTTLRARPLHEKARIVDSVIQNVWPLIGKGRVKPVLEKEYPLRYAADAHKYFDSVAHRGKILLTN